MRLLLVLALLAPASAYAEAKVTVTDKAILLPQPIYFDTAKATIKPASHSELDALAATLNSDQHLTLVEIQVHTDERGDDQWNLELSQKRADAIVAYLAARQVDGHRLRAHGYGETRPLDPHHTPAAWAKNRRTELVILQRTT